MSATERVSQLSRICGLLFLPFLSSKTVEGCCPLRIELGDFDQPQDREPTLFIRSHPPPDDSFLAR